jgi:hypothetical protein
MLLGLHAFYEIRSICAAVTLHVSSRRDYWHVYLPRGRYGAWPAYYELLSTALETGGSIDSKILDSNG